MSRHPWTPDGSGKLFTLILFLAAGAVICLFLVLGLRQWSENSDNSSGKVLETAKPALQTPGAQPTLLRMEYRMENELAVGNVELYLGDDHLPNYVDFAGMTVQEATLWGINALIERGYLCGKGGLAIELRLPGSDSRTVAGIQTLVTRMLEEAALPYDVVLQGRKRIRLTPANRAMPPRTAQFTMGEVLDATITKSAKDVTPEQLEILSIVFDKDKVDFMLTPRYFVLAPCLVGMTEDEAVKQLRELGMVPEVTRECNPEVSQDMLGKVFFQDYGPGVECEVGSRFLIFVLAEEPVPTAPPVSQQ